jgi:hypothetical protein
MKAEQTITNSTLAGAQDRLATWDEVRRATSLSPDRILEHCCTTGNYCEVDSDFGGIIRYPSEEFEFFAYLSDMDDASAN